MWFAHTLSSATHIKATRHRVDIFSLLLCFFIASTAFWENFIFILFEIIFSPADVQLFFLVTATKFCSLQFLCVCHTAALSQLCHAAMVQAAFWIILLGGWAERNSMQQRKCYLKTGWPLFDGLNEISVDVIAMRAE